MSRLSPVIAILWALPWTLFGLMIGLIGLATGGRHRRNGRVLEFWGGFTAWFLRRIPLVEGASAMTLGHVILARSDAELNRVRTHELVHVRQYERWGILLVPIYLGYSACLALRGKDPYRDNPFERQAFGDE